MPRTTRHAATHAGLVALAVTMAAAAGCVDAPTPTPSEPIHASVKTAELTRHRVRKIDLLLVVDDSSSMVEEQANLAANLGGFVKMLEAPDIDADYRIAVTTTDVGHGSCAPTGVPPGAFRMSSCLTRPEDFVDAQHASDADSADEFSHRGFNVEFMLRRDPSSDVPHGTRVTAECLMAADPAAQCPDLRF